MKSTYKSQRGQVLIIFVFAIIGLVAITGLAIDGASILSDRRHAQNAADTAALAAALAKANWEATNGAACGTINTSTSTVPTNGCNAVNKALDTAGYNGYANGSAGTASLDVYSPPIDGYYKTCSNGDCTPSKYVEIVIKTDVSTWFAKVIGIGQTHNTVEAVALADTAHIGSPFPGYAIVGLNPNPPAAPHDMSFQAQSNAMQVYISGGGVFANGTAQDVHSTVHISSPYCATAVDSVTGFTCTSPSSPNPALEIQYPASVLELLPPIPQCLGTATVDGSDVVHPDANSTKANTGSKVNGFDHVKYLPGLYCVQNIGSNTTSSLDITGAGVTFYMMDSTFSFKFKSSAGSLGASAPVADASQPWTVTYAGMLMFSNSTTPNPYGGGTCPQQLDLRGSSTTPVVGTIMMPGACISWLGNTGGAAQTQVIAWDMYFSGNTDASFNYSANSIYNHSYPGQVGLVH